MINELIPYLIKVILLQGFLFVFYYLFFRKSARHAFNRIYLLAAFMGAFLVPLMEISFVSEVAEIEDATPMVFWISEPVEILQEVVYVPVHYANAFSFWSLAPWVYTLVVAIFMLRFGIHFLALNRLKSTSTLVHQQPYRLYKTRNQHPFSFLRNVFMPQALFGSVSYEQILAHEQVHLRKNHSLDRIILDFIGSFLWFNPFIYLYRRALIEVHEYQADEVVINQFKDPLGYQEILFDQLQSSRFSGLVSHFNFQLIKKRIVMMNRQTKMSRLIYLMIVPLMLLMIVAFSSKEVKTPISLMGSELATLIDADQAGISFASDQNEVPSILPLKNTSDVRMASDFGMKMHPLLKVEKMHTGVDFKCPEGTEVIATATGTVMEVEASPTAYGKRIRIDHGNGYVTQYAHLSEFEVELGEKVERGDLIAFSGNTGFSSGPHLHYEVIKDGEKVDPAPYIKNYEAKRAKHQPKHAPSSTPKQQAKYKVFVDPGHGGHDEGATSPSGVNEKDISLTIAQLVQATFVENEQIEVILTRNTDHYLSLPDRVAKTEGADLLISLHLDIETREGSLFIPVFDDQSEHAEGSKRLADELARQFESIGKDTQVGYSNGYYLLKKATCPAVLVHLGAISDPEEDRFLSSNLGRKKIADQIASAIAQTVL